MHRHLRNAAISGGISSTGDILLQCRDGLRRPSDWESMQTARIACFRTVHAPVVDACWRWLDVRLPFLGTLRGSVLRALADQTLLMPPSLLAFFYSQALLEGLDLQAAGARVRDAFWPTACIAFPYWMTAHTLTFAAFAPQHRMAWAQCCAVLWNALASQQNQIARQGEMEKARIREEEEEQRES